ncbi:MAG: hypothetical protein E6G83_16775, partial [Alphaproteobacteria bacterium]
MVGDIIADSRATSLGIRRYRAAVESGQDSVDGFGLDERFGAGIVFGEISIDNSLQVGDRAEYPTADALAVILGTKFSTALSQEAEVGVKWKISA